TQSSSTNAAMILTGQWPGLGPHCCRYYRFAPPALCDRGHEVARGKRLAASSQSPVRCGNSPRLRTGLGLSINGMLSASLHPKADIGEPRRHFRVVTRLGPPAMSAFARLLEVKRTFVRRAESAAFDPEALIRMFA